uniref:KAT8 regulatory NSL complex subunit 2 n=1 Tax=Physcomitrium patens TaxID=3218 RepID=A0A7I4BR11_PHYPA
MQQQQHHHPPSDDDGAGSDDDQAIPSLQPLLSLAATDPLHHAHVLTREQLVHRRARRLRHLLRMYRHQYWGLLEELRSKYRRFYLRTGKSGWRGREVDGDPNPTPAPGEMKQPNAPETPGTEISRCGAQGCDAKPLLLSRYCYTHILQEPRQRLYKPCSFTVRRGSEKNGSGILCQKPVLQAVSPPLCPTHFQQTQKQAARSLRKAGIMLPLGYFPKSAPKLHHFVAEYVRVIQSKRRTALRNTHGRGETSATNGETTYGVSGISNQAGALILSRNTIHKREAEEHPAERNGQRTDEASGSDV